MTGGIPRIEYAVDVGSISSLKGRKMSMEGKTEEDAIKPECAKPISDQSAIKRDLCVAGHLRLDQVELAVHFRILARFCL